MTGVILNNSLTISEMFAFVFISESTKFYDLTRGETIIDETVMKFQTEIPLFYELQIQIQIFRPNDVLVA